MLTLHHGPRTVVTDESFSVKLKWVNPCCFMDSIPGDVGLGIEISVNEYTRAEYGNPHRFAKFSTANDRKFPNHAIRKNGVSLISGTLVITNATASTYTAWLQSEVGVLGTQQRDKFITEQSWKNNVTFENKVSYNPAGGDEYACPTVLNPMFWDGKGRTAKETLTFTDPNGITQTKEEETTYLSQQFRKLHGYLINEIGLYPKGVEDSGEGCVISPFLFLKYVISELFKVNGFFIDQENNALDDFDNPLLLYNNFNIFFQEFTTEQKTDYYWDDILKQYVPESNWTVSHINWILSAFDYANLVPKISLKDFILGLQNFLNVVFVFRSDNSVKLINRNNIIEADPYDLDQYFIGSWIMGDQKDVTLKFVQEFDKDDELYSKDWHDLSDRLGNYKDPVTTKADLLAVANPQLGDLRLVIVENKIYEYKWGVFTATNAGLSETQTDILEWVAASINPQYLIYGTSDEIEEIKTPFSSLSRVDGGVDYPEVHQSGNLASAKSIWSNFAPRLIAYNIGAANASKLDFDGTSGIFETHWRRWATFWKTRLPVEGEFMLPLNILQYVINNITQPYRTREGKFIIEEIECDFQGELMGLVRVRGYKI